MFLESIDKVIDFLDENDLRHFVVTTKDSDNSKVFETREDDPYEVSVDRFKRVMSLGTGTRFILKARRVYKDNRGGYVVEFRNNLSELPSSAGQGAAAISGIPAGYISTEELNRRLAEEKKSIMTDLRLQQLESENKELKSDLKAATGVTSRVLSKVEPYIGSIIGVLANKLIPGGAQIGIAGTDNDFEQVSFDSTEKLTEDQQDDAQNELEAALRLFAENEKEFVKFISIIAKFSASTEPITVMGFPVKYSQFRDVVLNANI